MKNYKAQQTFMPYLMLVNAAAFIDFVQLVFNADVRQVNKAEDNRTVLYAEIQIGHTVLLLTEAKDKYGKAVGSFFIYVGDADETFNRAVFHGASVVTEVTDRDFGRSGGIEDPFGNTWWLTTA
jgi:PhnB protein